MNNKYFDINHEGHSIRCKLYYNHPRDLGRVVVFGHGFGGHKDNKAAERFADTLLSREKDAAVLTFNWPAHGDDVKKHLSLPDCDTYIRLVLDYVRDTLQAEDVCVYATSFGGYLFLKYTAEHGCPARKIALRCPAVDLYESFTQRIMQPEDREKLARGKDMAVGFDRKVAVDRKFLEDIRAADVTKMDFLEVSEQFLILHGTRDEIIPFDVSEKFADDNLIEFVPIERADHRFQDPAIMGVAIKRIIEFLERE